eukprot:Awhi_evm1s12437
MDTKVMEMFKAGYSVHKVEYGDVDVSCPLADLTESFKHFYGYKRRNGVLVSILSDIANSEDHCPGVSKSLYVTL